MTRAEMIDEICDHMNVVRSQSNEILFVIEMSLSEIRNKNITDVEIAAYLSSFRELSKNLKACFDDEKKVA
jgi:hypothetical protein